MINGETSIYVDNKEFIICKAIVFEYESKRNKITSVDEVLEYVEVKRIDQIDILPQQIFWGHCSNLEFWAENHYDCKLLSSTIAFPLLKKLSEAGDSIAKKKFKEEIAKKFEIDYLPSMIFLVRNNYLKYLSKDELQYVIQGVKKRNRLIYDFLVPYLISEEIIEIPRNEKIEIMKKFETDLEEGKFKPLNLHEGITSEIPFIKFKIKNKSIKGETSRTDY